MSTRIAILGTCTSEDWYHFQGLHDRLDVKILRFQPSSVISLMAEPVNMAIEGGSELQDKEVARLRTDFDKSFLSALANFKPDVLIVEALSDSRRGVIPVGTSWVTRTYRVEKSPMEERLGFPKPFNAINQPDAYCALYREAARRFSTYLADTLPDCRVVLHKARWSEYFVDENNELKSYRPKLQREYFVANLRLDVLERIFCEEVRCDTIDIDDFPVFADALHVWGPSSDHYIKVYYKTFTDRLRRLLATSVPQST